MRDPREGRSTGGLIETGAAASRIGASFRTAVDAIVAAVVEAEAHASLYLYGSVATGQAEVGRSDVDMLAIGLPVARARSISSDLSDRYADLCRGIAIGAARPQDFVGGHDEAYGNRVFLRHYCVHLAGPDDFRPEIDFPADARAARGFNGDIAAHLEGWRADLAAGSDSAIISRRVARKSLLALAGLVSMHDGTWTTDRTTAVERWSEIEPDRSAGLAALLDWTDHDGHVDAEVVRRMLDDVVDPLVDRFASEIGLWA